TRPVKKGEVVVRLDDQLFGTIARGAEASLARAHARRDWSRRELERITQLFKRGTIGLAEHDRAEVAVREADAGVLAMEAALQEARIRLERTRIVAPFDGRLVRIYPDAGEYVREGATVFRIIDVSQLRVVVNVPAHLVGLLEIGREVGVTADFESGKALLRRGRIFSIAPAADGASRTYRVEARLEDATKRLRPGMAAWLWFEPPLASK
ncbi:MAG: efflux RND transporter periplasmic adaptor subunit, partial [Planctomycetota bacterium]|nr:efflux RND transporter periplasmic adaptor subunit [Planctomycetota bacterium]